MLPLLPLPASAYVCMYMPPHQPARVAVDESLVRLCAARSLRRLGRLVRVRVRVRVEVGVGV